MQYLRSNIAKKVGRAVDWQGKFWDRRYDAAAVLDDDALVDRCDTSWPMRKRPDRTM